MAAVPHGERPSPARWYGRATPVIEVTERSRATRDLAALLDRRRDSWDRDLAARYPFLDAVLAGEMAVVVYPAARLGRRAAADLLRNGIRVVAFGDRNEALEGTLVDGVPVLSPGAIAARHAEDAILVASALHDSAICRSVAALGCRNVAPVGYLNRVLPSAFRIREYDGAASSALDPANRPSIDAAFELMSDQVSRRVFFGKLDFYLGLDKSCIDSIQSAEPIYFDPTVYSLRADEVVVDGGAYTGDTLQALRTQTGGEFRSYLAFEPDTTNLSALSAAVGSDVDRVRIVAAGISDHSGEVRFLPAQTADSRILGPDEDGGTLVRVVALDDFLEGGLAPTLIKLDIEGAEAAALQGGATTIARYAPVLAVSAYHFPSDLWAIPLLLHRLEPRSSIFLRHYTPEVDDTVCYAIPPDRLPLHLRTADDGSK